MESIPPNDASCKVLNRASLYYSASFFFRSVISWAMHMICVTFPFGLVEMQYPGYRTIATHRFLFVRDIQPT